jgi:hypothetical protein
VVEFVESSSHDGSLEAEYYLKAMSDLALMKDIGFVNVQFFLLSRNRSAIINLIGLHYSIACLHMLVSHAFLMFSYSFPYRYMLSMPQDIPTTSFIISPHEVNGTISHPCS